MFHDQKTLQNALDQTAHGHDDVNAADAMLNAAIVMCKQHMSTKGCKDRSPKYNMPFAHLRPTIF